MYIDMTNYDLISYRVIMGYPYILGTPNPQMIISRNQPMGFFSNEQNHMWKRPAMLLQQLHQRIGKSLSFLLHTAACLDNVVVPEVFFQCCRSLPST